jgi:hypothetical protein
MDDKRVIEALRQNKAAYAAAVGNIRNNAAISDAQRSADLAGAYERARTQHRLLIGRYHELMAADEAQAPRLLEHYGIELPPPPPDLDALLREPQRA